MFLIMTLIMIGSHLLTLATGTIIPKVAATTATAVGPLIPKVAEDTTSPLEGADILSPVLPMLTIKDAEVDTPSPVHTPTHHSKETTQGDSNIIIKSSTRDSTETESR